MWNLFENDTVLPAQFDALQRTKRGTPHETLCLAVLERALGDARDWSKQLTWKLGTKERKAVELQLAEVQAWFAEEDGDSPFSFVNVCEHVGCDPRFMRQVAQKHGVIRRKPVVSKPIGWRAATPGQLQAAKRANQARCAKRRELAMQDATQAG